MERSSSSAQNPFCPKRCLCKSLGWKNNSLKSNKVRTVSERCVEVKGTLGMLVQWVVSSGRKHLSNLNIKTNAKWTSMHFFTCWQLNPGSNRTILKKVQGLRVHRTWHITFTLHAYWSQQEAGGRVRLFFTSQRGVTSLDIFKNTYGHLKIFWWWQNRVFFGSPRAISICICCILNSCFLRQAADNSSVFCGQIHMNCSRVVDHLHLRVWRPKQLFQDARFTECSFCIPWHRQVCRRNLKADKIRQKTPARCPLHLQLSLMTKAFRYLDLLDNLMKV